ncbi:Ig-like domain-containing protein, partial [Ursidibacter arcticus]|uniref:Ig-like domain-containing protein n=1 Tax=Ursidibacter arcticus TaxID=1524965 RepID=UPI0012F8A47A
KADSKPESEESSPKEVTKIEGGNPADHLGDTQDPTAPTLTKTDDAGKPAEKGDGAVKVQLPTDAVEGDKAEINFTDEGNNPVKAVYEKQADGSWNRIPAESQNVPNELPTTVPSTAPSFVIPEDKLKDGTAVTAKSIDVAGNDTDATPVNAGFDEPVRTPVLEAGYPKSQNNSDNPDTNAATEAVLVGTADPKAVIKVQDKDGTILTPTATANDKGEFTLTIPNADLAKGPFKLIAELTENGTTESSAPTAEIPVAQTVQPGTPDPEATDKESLSKDKGGYPNDNTPPPAPTINTGSDGDGKVTVGLPADAKNGDKVTITYTDEGNNPQEVVVTKAQDGWKVPADSPISQDKINGNNLEIPADSVKDKTEVTARTQDLAGNLSEKKKDTSKYDEVTAEPSLTVNAIDTAEKADNTIDALVVTGTVKKDNAPENGAKVKLLHNGAEIVPTDKGLVANDAGEYKAVLVKKGTEKAVVDKLKAKYPDHTIIEVEEVPTTGNLTAIAQKEGKAQSPNTDAAIPTTLTNDTTDHPLDAANPTAPGLQAFGFADGPEKQGDVEVTFPTDAVEGDTVAVTITPPAGSADKTPKVITFTKGKDAWTSNPALPAGYTVDGNKLHIESTSIPDGATVSATSTDLAGKTAEGQAVTAQQDPRQTTKPEIKEIKVDDTDAAGDKSPETVTIKGTIVDTRDHNAEVTLYNKAGEAIAKVTATNGNFEFTLTKVDASKNEKATETGDKAPTNGQAKLTEIPTADKVDFTVKAKSTGASLSEAENVNLPSLDQPMKQQTLEVYSDGTDELKAGDKVGLFDKNGNKIATATVGKKDDSELGKFNFTVTKGDPAGNDAETSDIKLAEIPDSKDLVVKKLPDAGATATPAENTPVTFYTKGKISGTEETPATEGKPKETITRTDTTPDELSVKLTPVSPNGKAYNVTEADPTGFDTKEKIEKADPGLSIDIENPPKEGDILTVTVKTPADSSEKVATFTYSNGAWSETADNDNLYADVPTKSADGNKTELDNAEILKKLKAGDEVTVTISDLAGNTASSRKIVTDTFANADAPVVKMGSRTTKPATDDKDPNAADRLITNFESGEAGKPNAVNAGDILFRPGENNLKLAVSYIQALPKGNTDAPADAETTIYGQYNEDTRKWTFHTQDNGTGEAVEGITEVIGQDGYVYYRIPADKVADNTLVTVVGTNDKAQSLVTPNAVAEQPITNEENLKLAATSTVSDMDDKTDNAIGIINITQPDNINISVSEVADKDGDSGNDDQKADANKIAVKFDASHLTPEAAKSLGLKVNTQGGSETVANEQFIVAVKQPNGTWTLHHTDATTLDDALKTPTGEQPNVAANIATVANGMITLKKDVVNGRSEVIAKAQDPYGYINEKNQPTTHDNPAEKLVVVDPPKFEDLGFGTVVLSPGENNDKVEISGLNGTPIVITKTDDTYSITSPSVTEGNLPEGVKAFDPNTGRITLTSETPKEITATGKKNPQGNNIPTDAVTKHNIDPTFDPSPNTVDPIESITTDNGAVTIKPGVDNTKLTVKYRDNYDNEQTVTFTKTGKAWAADKNQDHFDIDNAKGTITLKADKVKDMTEVTAKAANKAGLETPEVSATPGMYDATPSAADKPDAKAGEKGNVVVDKGTDNVKVEIEYSPRAQPTTGAETKEKITALYDIATNKWKLVDSDNLPVDKDIATIDENNGTVTLKRGSLKDNSQVTAKGIDINDNISTADTESVSGTLPAGAEGIPSGGATGAGSASGASGNTGGDEGDYTPKYNLNDSFGYLYVTQDNPSDDDNNVKIRAEISKPGRISRDFNAVFKVKYDGKEYDLAVAGGNGQQLFVALLDPAKSGYDNAVANNGQYFSWHNAGLAGNKNSLPATVEALYQATGQSRGYYKDIQISLTNGQSKAYKDITSGDVPETNGRPDGKPLYDYLKKVEAIEKIVSQGAISNSAIQEIEFKNEPDSEIKLYADTIEPGTGGNKLDVRVYTEGSDQSGVFEYKLRNYNERTDITVEKTPNKVTLTPESDGSMTVKPDSKHNEIVLSYVDESGRTKEARLTKGSNGVWTDSSNTGDFEISGNTIKIKADSLRDNLKDSVIAKAKQPMEGSKYYTYSDVAKATPGADPQAYDPSPAPSENNPVSPKPTTQTSGSSIPSVANPSKSLAEAMNEVSTPNAPDDIAVGKKLLGGYREQPGYTKLKELLNAQSGLHSVKGDGTHLFAFSGNNQQILKVAGSLGNSTNGNVYRKQPIELDLQGGDDILNLENNVDGAIVKLGNGNDILAVGTGNKEFKLYVNKDADISQRYQYTYKDQGSPNGSQVNSEKSNNNYPALRDLKGGRIIDSEVIGGSGDDVVLIEGALGTNNRPAVDGSSKIELGAGNDALIIAPHDIRKGNDMMPGSIGGAGNKAAPFVNMGDGDDYLKATGIDGGAKVYMGDGNDYVDIQYIHSSATVLNTGDGQDTVIINGASDGGAISLGAGNDRIEFTASNTLGLTTSSVFSTKVDGGAGYDVFVLKHPTNNAGAVFDGKRKTHLSTEDLFNIEEIRMGEGSAIDIRAVDLRSHGMSKLKLIAEGSNSKGSVAGKDARLVDLSSDSASDSKHDTTNTVNTTGFTKVADQTEYGINYEVYRAGSSEVWIQKDYFTVI